ncbi:MAG: hypothetical protein U0840_30665 [Gemmataceae bacterium]
MIESVSRPRLPKGRSYVLKTTQLADALAASGIDWRVDLVYWSPRAGGSILEGHYWPPSENVPYQRVYVRAGSVPSSLRPAAAEALRESALPQFIHWVEGLLALPDGSPALAAQAYFNATFTTEGLAITDRPVNMVPRRAQ